MLFGHTVSVLTWPASPARELTRMKAAAMAALVRMLLQRRKSSNGLKKMPPPTPVIPETNPSPAPAGMAMRTDGVLAGVRS